MRSADARPGDATIRLEHRFADVADGIRLHYVEAGTGPLVVLVHGFPEFWFSYRRVLPALAARGFRVVAPDLRGFNLSSKPEGVRAYGIDVVVEDIAGLIRALGEERANIVGHDVGAGISWAFAMTHPEMVSRLAVLNGPHPKRLLDSFRKNPAQMLKSWYVFFFQLPLLPEAVAALDRYELLIKALRDEPRRPFGRDELERYREAFAEPGALTAMIHYYRAMFRPKTNVKIVSFDGPTLVVWGEEDPHLGRELATPDPELVPNARVEFVPDATHWVHHDQPERVVLLLEEHLRAAPGAVTPRSS
jgi:pimeloyl-ACP methyl ester carboxylesterase